MLGYNVWLAWRSVRRHPVLSALIVGGIALGVGVSSAFITVYYLLAADPVPGRSHRLHHVRMDSWDPQSPHPHDSGLPPQITYRDLRAVMKSDLPVRQTGTFRAQMYVYPENRDDRPWAERVRLVHGDFFPMFEVPFRYGGPWDAGADDKPEAVAVVSAALNDRLFGGGDSVGRRIRLADREFTVVGVLAPWRPRLRFYDLTSDGMGEPESVFLPFNWVEPMEISSAGNRDNWISLPSDSSDSFSESLNGTEMTWVQLWVELPDERRRQEYHAFVDAYTLEQKALGRFQRPLNNRVTPIRELMREWRVVPSQATALAIISVLFLAVASLNLVGLFLGKFLARAPVVGVRRALGASRGAIFLQHFVEAEVVGLLGGALGLLLSVGILALLSRAMGSFVQTENFFHLDGTMVLAAVLLSLVAGAIAGLYPSWRICSLPPARHLKTQ
jgi:putative ABC transport system permease protein